MTEQITPQLSASDAHRGRHLRTESQPAPKASRYQIAIITGDIDDMVSWAGGWLYDHINAGWVVNDFQISADAYDLRPLTILGYRPVLDETVDMPAKRNRVLNQTLAVSSDVVADDKRVRWQVQRAISQQTTRVVVWGEGPTGPLADRLVRCPHHLTSAALAYKAQAMRTTASPNINVSEIEYFYCSPFRPAVGSAAGPAYR